LKGTDVEMDNFMDKLAQRFNAQELIKANSEAETKELKKLKLQISEYEQILQEMRKLNYKNTEISEKFELMISENADKIQAIKEDEQNLINSLQNITDEQTRNMESDLEQREEERLERERAYEVKKDAEKSAFSELSTYIDDKFQNSEDFNHKENVKVYRNVQAVVVDELKRSNEMIKEENLLLKKKLNTTMCLGIIAAVASFCNIIIWVTIILMYSGIF
jgi:hypothetical protein